MTKCSECGNDVSSNAAACPKCGAKPKKKSTLLKIILATFVLAVFLSLGKNKNTQLAPAAGEPAMAKSSTDLNDLNMDFEFAKSGFGSVEMINGTITNAGPTNVKDVKIECEGYAASGTKIDTNKRTLYQAVEAGKTLKFKDFNMGFINSQVKKTSCSIVGFEPA